METYTLVNGEIKITETLGAKNPIVKQLKAEIEELKDKKAIVPEKIADLETRKIEIQAEIDNRKDFLTSIGE